MGFAILKRLSGTCGGNLEEAAGLVEHMICNLKRPGLVEHMICNLKRLGLVEHVIGNLEEARLSGICDWQS